MKMILLISSVLVLFASEMTLADNNHCASLTKMTGDVLVIHKNNEFKAKLGTRLFQKDLIRSGPDSSAGIIFQDDTIISLGPNSELCMEEFLFNPKENEFSFTTKLFKGTFMFISGVIGKLSPESIKIETPDGTIAIRGTKFLVKVAE